MTNNLKELRKKRQMTQVELAEKFGVTKEYISIIERGAQTPGFKLANDIASYFEVTVDELNFFY